MKTTVVPAQITTVEDRIAGSFTLQQIVLLVFSMIVGLGIYAMLAPKMHLSQIKLVLILLQFSFLGGLALRINGKIVADWLIVFLRFKARPRQYIFTKNDPIYREIIEEKENVTIPVERTQNKMTEKDKQESLTLVESINIDKIFDNDSLSISFKPSKKGGVDVILKQQ